MASIKLWARTDTRKIPLIILNKMVSPGAILMTDSKLDSLRRTISILQWDLSIVTDDTMRKNKQARLEKLQTELKVLTGKN